MIAPCVHHIFSSGRTRPVLLGPQPTPKRYNPGPILRAGLVCSSLLAACTQISPAAAVNAAPLSAGPLSAGPATGPTALRHPDKESPMAPDPANPAPAGLISLTGTRLSQGNAVECPQIRDAAGAVHAVSYLSPGVAIGARVTVSGVYGITTSCRGTVLVVAHEQIE